jgi:exonuclease III
MDHQNRSMKRDWKILCWNIRGINSRRKWVSIRSNIHESTCDIGCLQETKRESFDLNYLKNFCPVVFDCFDYVPSEDNSGGIITFWKSSRFIGKRIFQNKFALSTEFTSTMSGERWILTNVYAPCSPNGRQDFLNRMNDIDMHVDTDWLLIGDFNLIRRLFDQNKNGGNIHDMLIFNATLSNLRLEELKFFGNKYTWANKQESPLFERLDWFFTSCT